MMVSKAIGLMGKMSGLDSQQARTYNLQQLSTTHMQHTRASVRAAAGECGEGDDESARCEGGVSGVNVDAVVFGLFSRCELCCLTLRAYCTSIDTTPLRYTARPDQTLLRTSIGCIAGSSVVFA